MAVQVFQIIVMLMEKLVRCNCILMYISSRYAKCVEVKLKQNHRDKRNSHCVQYVKNKERVKLCRKLLVLTGWNRLRKINSIRTLIRIQF